MKAWKVLTHDWRPPVQGGDPVVPDGVLPFTLPTVPVERSEFYGEGWHFCADPGEALRAVGLWPDGRPSRLIVADVGKRRRTVKGEMFRVSGGTLLREATEAEWRDALGFGGMFGAHETAMVDAQLVWRAALGRPFRDRAAVEAGLQAALVARGLDWSLREYPAAWAARAAWAAWDAWDARAARAAWAAWDALTVRYAALNGWTDHDPDLLTTGIIDAYLHGLVVAVPVAEGVLGWVMAGEVK